MHHSIKRLAYDGEKSIAGKVIVALKCDQERLALTLVGLLLTTGHGEG